MSPTIVEGVLMFRSRTSILVAGAAILFLAPNLVASGALAQDDIDFGDDASRWSNDGECDDPRFEGESMTSTALLDEDIRHDATDCRTAYEAGTLTLRAAQPEPVFEPTLETEPATEPGKKPFVTTAQPSLAADDGVVDYGDDASLWSNDGECDDPRFEGENVVENSLRENAGHDATDCRLSVAAGTASYVGELEAMFEGVFQGVDFGDNSGGFPGDGECDDPRFSGSNVAAGANRSNAGHDAHDCKISVEEGTATYNGELAEAFTGVFDGVDFGDNEGTYPMDGECDDPRFSGANVAVGANRVNAGHDADDCKRSYEAGTASFDGELEALFEGEDQGVDFGDNSGPYVDDEECDDPRFEGEAMAAATQRENARRDAHDCHEAFVAGTATYTGELEPLFAGSFQGIEFGNNEGPYVDDGECDDRRFRGPGMAHTPWNADSEYRDAADCKWMFERGFVTFIMADGLREGAVDGIQFGDNSGAYANDGECDDSRFEGPGVGATTGENDKRDSHDCIVNYEAHLVVLKPE